MIVPRTYNWGDVIIYDQGGKNAEPSAGGLLLSPKQPSMCWTLIFKKENVLRRRKRRLRF